MMNIKQKILISVVVLLASFGCVVSASQSVMADCGGVKTSIINCDESGGTDVTNTGLWGVLLLAINILTAGVGVAALAGLIYGAVLYTTSGDSPEQVKKSHTIIKNVVIGLVMYALLYSLMNYLIPGGIFN